MSRLKGLNFHSILLKLVVSSAFVFQNSFIPFSLSSFNTNETSQESNKFDYENNTQETDDKKPQNDLNKIFIKSAVLLDQNSNEIRNIYNNVKELDDKWEKINNGQSIEVTFEKPLDSTKDITIYAKPAFGNKNSKIDIYTENSNKLLASFTNINKEDTYKIFLTNLKTANSTFVLKVSGEIDIDLIVDPSTWTEHEVSGALYWMRVASSSDGTKLAAINYNGYIYTSSDSGNTWVARPQAKVRVWREIAISADGSQIAVTSHYNNIVMSYDYGATWIEQTGSGSKFWLDIKSSADGSRLVAVGGLGGPSTHYINTSSDHGVTWTQQTTAGQRYWGRLASSADGSRLAAAVTGGLIYTSSDYGVTWSPQASSGSKLWTYIVSSTDGSKLAAAVSSGYVYTSPDYGVTWFEQTNSGVKARSFLASSADGSKLVATVVNDYIYTSPDYGVTWTQQTSLGADTWYAVSSSADGTKLIIAKSVSEYLYTSSDSGETVQEHPVNGIGASWIGSCISSSGTFMAAVASGNGYIYTSSNSGTTWAKQLNSGSRNWSSITCTSDGSKLAATVSSGYIYTSSDYGLTWIERTNSPTKSWYGIDSSSDGSFIAAVALSSNIYTSTDYGATWVEQNNSGSRFWTSITCSSNCSKLAATVSGGYIYTSADNGVTWNVQTNSGQKSWMTIDSSADGSTILATFSSIGYILISHDSGSTWSNLTNAGINYWQQAVTSSEGTRFAATSLDTLYFADTAIYTSKDSGTHWVKQISFDRNASPILLSSSADGKKLFAPVQQYNIFTGNIDMKAYPPEFILDQIDNPNHDPTPTITGSINESTGIPTKIEFQVDGTSDIWGTCELNSLNESDNQSFEDSFPPSGYSFGDDANWTRDAGVHQEGSYSAASGTITGNQSTAMTKTFTFEHDAILNFYWKVSSEATYDFLYVCIDDESCTPSSGYDSRISGTLDWTLKQVKIPQGTHTVTWKYSKDGGTNSGSDKGWIDNISFTYAEKFTCNSTSPLTNGNHKIYLRAEDSNGDSTAIEDYTMKEFTVDYDVLVTESNGTTKIFEDGQTDNIFVSLAIAPTNDVTLNLSTSDDTVTILPSSLSFTSLTWSTPQEIVISASNNNKIDKVKRNEYINFSGISTDSNYNDPALQNFLFKIYDHDYGRRISDINKNDINLLIDKINGVDNDVFSKDSNDESYKKVIINSNKLDLTFDNLKTDAEIDKYTIRLQKTDSLGRPIGSYSTWIDNIDDKDKEYNKKLDKEGYSITYKDGKIRFKADGDKYRLKDGTYYLKVRAYDKVGNFVQSDAVKLVVDDSPEVKLSLYKIGSIPFEPQKYNTYYYTNNNVLFSGNATKGDKIVLFVNGQEIASTISNDTSNYIIQTTVPNGSNNISIKSVDTEITFQLFIDPTRSNFPEFLKN